MILGPCQLLIPIQRKIFETRIWSISFIDQAYLDLTNYDGESESLVSRSLYLTVGVDHEGGHGA